MQLQTLILWL